MTTEHPWDRHRPPNLQVRLFDRTGADEKARHHFVATRSQALFRRMLVEMVEATLDLEGGTYRCMVRASTGRERAFGLATAENPQEAMLSALDRVRRSIEGSGQAARLRRRRWQQATGLSVALAVGGSIAQLGSSVAAHSAVDSADPLRPGRVATTTRCSSSE